MIRANSSPRTPARAPTPDLSTITPGAVVLVIVAYENSDAPPGYPPDVGYAAGLTYTVSAQLPSGVVFSVSGVRPSVPREQHPRLVHALPSRPPGENTRPYRYPGGISNGEVFLYTAETRYSQQCEGGA